jgi:hypothetical protein
LGERGTPGPVAPPTPGPEAPKVTEVAPEVKPEIKPAEVKTEAPAEIKPEIKPPEIKKAKPEKIPELATTRTKRINAIRKQISDMEDAGETDTTGTLHKNLQSELTNAQIEKTGSKRAKEIVVEMDNTLNRMEELEAKQEKVALNNDEQKEYDSLSGRHASLEKKRDFEIKPETEKYGPRVGSIRELHGEGALSKLDHKALSDRAKADYGVKSLADMKPEQLKEFQDTLKTERMEREAETQRLEEKGMDEELTPKEKSRLKKLLEDESGESSVMKGLVNVANLISPITKGWIKSGESVLRGEGAGEMVEDMRRARTIGEMRGGNLVADYHANMKGLSDAEARNVLEVIKGEGRAMSPKVAEAARKENDRLKDVLKELGDTEVNINPLETERKDKAVLSDFYTAAGRKLGESTQLGKRTSPPAHMRDVLVGGIPQDIHLHIGNIKRRGGDWRTAYKIADAFYNPNRMSGAEQSMWDKFSNFEAATKLGLSVISNATQSANTALVTGNYTLLKSIAKEIQDFDKLKELGLRSGSTLSSVTHETQLTSGLAPESFAGKMLEKTGFSPVEVHNRLLASMSGAKHAVDMFKRLKENPNDAYARRHLKYWLGLDPDTLLQQDKIKMEQVMIGAHTMSDRTQHRTSPLEVPYKWGASPEARMFTLFKNFAYNQSNFLYQSVIKELKNKNMRPLIPLLTTMPLLGTLADRTKRAILGNAQPKDFWEAVIGAYSAVGGLGIVGDLASRAAVGKLANWIEGPVIGDVVDGIEAAFKAAKQGSPTPVTKEVVKRVPVVGRPIENRVYPKAEKKAPRGWDQLPDVMPPPPI